MSSSKATWLSLVALPAAQLPDPNEVQRALAGRRGEQSPLEVASQTDGMVTCRWEESTIAYTLVPRPIPQAQIEGPCATAWYWPQAAVALGGHQAHLLVTLVDEGRDAVDKSIRLTAFVSALSGTCPTVGIFWAPAGLVHEPAAFAEQARQMSRDDLPLYLWVGFRLERLADGRHRLFTTGLEAFDRKELEIETPVADPQQLLHDVYNVVHYHLVDSSAIKDADTIGLPDGRQFRARHQESLLGDERRVVWLEYDAPIA